jgi:Fic family protein
MRVTDKKYYNEYINQIGKEIPYLIEQHDFTTDDNGNLSYLTKASAVYSSNIEGNTIDLNSFMNYELSKSKFKPTKEIEEIENLITAYEFAQKTALTERNLLESHKILSKTLLIKSKRGKYREEPVGVFGKSGLIYLAIEPEYVRKEMKTFFDDITKLLSEDLNEKEVFYHASLIHLIFVHIHPFMDGNGRIARLIEKWFIAEKLGKDFWKIPSEEYYKNHLEKYYEAIDIGINYYELNYDKCINFLELLPSCMIK